ncbi:hypothetical protein [Mycolicibacterium palauense]|uniref:hypothetical protein n=1 Tax=Mycolicibacterium palauense TaxID=2034511 RepID=UPI000BFF0B48|nr:hypothetical protein [Mycolicibacterium palauense]
MSTTAPGDLYFSGTYEVPAAPRTPYRRLVVVWVIAIGVVAAGLVSLSGALQKPAARFACPPDCGRPPMGEPVAINPRFTAPDGAFSVSYPPPDTPFKVTTQDDGVTAELLDGDGGTMRLFSVPAAGRTPRQIASELVRKTFPDTKNAYEVPNAMVGYHPGYGLVADCWPQGMTASYSRMRVMVLVAVKDDLALVAGAVGPFHKFGPDFGPGLPSAANLEVAVDMGDHVNSFRWRDDPPR